MGGNFDESNKQVYSGIKEKKSFCRESNSSVVTGSLDGVCHPV